VGRHSSFAVVAIWVAVGLVCESEPAQAVLNLRPSRKAPRQGKPVRRVLIVTSSYYPAVLADTHRARVLAPELKSLGWEVEILAAGALFQRADAIESDAAPFFDLSIPVHFAGPCGDAVFRVLNMRSIGWRALFPLYQAGAKLLEQKRFDLIYITTAQFNLFCLGRVWYTRFCVPYVLDFHDPWVANIRRIVTTKHTVKFRINAVLATWLERFAINGASGIVSVSPTYVARLRDRCPSAQALRGNRAVVIPFAASERDLTVMPAQPEGSGALDIVYVGAGGKIMEKSWRAILRSLSNFAAHNPGKLERFRFRLFGTEAFWKEGEPKFLVEIAREYGLAHLIEEQPGRVSYFRALEIIQSSAGLIILGVDDPAYMPSKLFTYAQTGKPLLASLHARSQANDYFNQMPNLGRLIHFDDDEEMTKSGETQIQAFLNDVATQHRIDRFAQIEPWLSRSSAQKHIELFERVLST